MKKSIIIMSMILAAGTAMNATAQAAESNHAALTSPKYKNPTGKEFPILAWYSIIGDDNITKERYQELHDAGFNLSFSKFDHNSQIDKALKACEGTGVKLILTSQELVSDTEATVNRYKSNPLVAGYFLRDEPLPEAFHELRQFRDKVFSADTTHLGYLNLLPSIVGTESLGTATYDEYVQRFINEVDLPMVSYDFYPIVNEEGRTYVRAPFFENLEYISRVAKNNGLPFWAFCLAVEHATYPLPTAVHMRHEAFSALAYGAQAIQYYTYWQPEKRHSEHFIYKNAPINENGQRSSVWYLVRDLNREIQNLSWVFLGAELIDASHTGQLPAAAKALTSLPKPFSKIDADGEGVLVSHLKNGKNQFLMIVNRDIDQSQNVTIHKDKKVKRVMPDGSLKTDRDETVTIAPGDYLLYNWK